MIAKTLAFLKNASDIGRMYLLTRKPHIHGTLPPELADGPWVVIATRDRIEDGKPAYGTPSHRVVTPGTVFFVFVDEGDYWLYAVRGETPNEGLKHFYADPQSARALGPETSRRGLE